MGFFLVAGRSIFIIKNQFNLNFLSFYLHIHVCVHFHNISLYSMCMTCKQIMIKHVYIMAFHFLHILLYTYPKCWVHLNVYHSTKSNKFFGFYFLNIFVSSIDPHPSKHFPLHTHTLDMCVFLSVFPG